MTVLVAVALLLAGCTGDPSPSPSQRSGECARIAGDGLSSLPGRGSGVETSIDAMVSDGNTLLMVATVTGRADLPVLRSSTDAGATWTDGRLTDEAAAASQVHERSVRVAAVARLGSERRWLALGETDDQTFAWTSSDAQIWARTPVVGIDPDNDQVEGVAGFSGGGFVAVGYHWTAARSTPRIWRSPDGITWTPSKPPAAKGRCTRWPPAATRWWRWVRVS